MEKKVKRHQNFLSLPIGLHYKFSNETKLAIVLNCLWIYVSGRNELKLSMKNWLKASYIQFKRWPQKYLTKMFDILPKNCNLMSIYGGMFPVTIHLRERINPWH